MAKRKVIQPQKKRRIIKGCYTNEKRQPDMLRFNEHDLYPNDQQCPECGGDMYDDRSMILDSNPPQFRTYCKICHHNGSRFIN